MSCLRRLVTGLPVGRFWRVCVCVLGLVLVLPVIYLVFGFVAPVGQENWEHVREYLIGPAVWGSLVLAVCVGLCALLLGVPAAWCVANFQFPGRAIWSVLLVLPLAVPPYVGAYVTTEVREAFAPVLIWTRKEHGVDAYLLLERVHRYGWLILTLAAVLFPYIYLAARVSFSGRGRRLGEAARILGKGPWVTFFTVNLPMARPALAAGLFLVVMEVLNDYGAVMHFGVDNVTTVLFRTWFGLGDLASARRLASWTLLGIFVLLLAERAQRGPADYAAQGSEMTARRVLGSGGRFWCMAACAIPVVMGLVFPVCTLVYWLMRTGGTFDADALGKAAIHSLSLGVGVGVVCLAIGAVLLGSIRFGGTRVMRWVGSFTSAAGYACPGAVLAVGALGVCALLPGAAWLVGTLFLLVFTLCARFYAVSGQMLGQAYTGMPVGMDRASRVLGSNPLRTFVAIHLPLLRPAFAGAMALIFVDVVKELPISLLLRPFDFETLGTWTYGFANQGKVFSCAAPALVIIFICGIVLALVEVFGWNRVAR